jgi:hypothetical protein
MPKSLFGRTKFRVVLFNPEAGAVAINPLPIDEHRASRFHRVNPYKNIHALIRTNKGILRQCCAIECA